MPRGLYFFLIAVLFCIRPSESADDIFTCDNTTSYHFNRKFISCWSSDSQRNVVLPSNISKDVEYLSIVAKNGSTLWIDRIDMFQDFHFLVGLEITLSKSVFISEAFIDSETRRKLESELFAIPSMQILMVTFSENFNKKKFNWVLPASLREFTLINSTIDFDLRPCVDLRKLNLSRTNLSKMPVIEEFPRLTTLDLSFNPLYEFTTNDIASFCSLNFLSIQDANMSECECIRLKNYVEVMQKNLKTFQFVGRLGCEDKDSKNHNCSNYTLHEAMELRRKCVVELMRPWAVILTYFSIIILFLVAFGIGCCVFLLKNFTNIGSHIKD